MNVRKFIPVMCLALIQLSHLRQMEITEKLISVVKLAYTKMKDVDGGVSFGGTIGHF